MNNPILTVVLGVLAFCQFVMRGVGVIDTFLSGIMNAFGIADPQRQIYILLVLTAALVVFALRVVGGLLGWVLLIFLVLLLMHRIVPGLVAPSDIVPGPLNTAL